MYSTKVNGEALEFGTSGLLYRSNKLMYDRGTKTLWVQFRGEPVVGPLVDSGIVLEVLPIVLTTWSEWQAAHPDTTVLDINTGLYPPELYLAEEHPDSVYYDYRESPEPIFPMGQRSDLLPTKTQVLGINVDGRAKAYPLEVLRQEPIVNDSLGGENIVVVTTKEGGARVFQRGMHLFSLVVSDREEEGSIILVDQQGRHWQMEEEALVRVDAPSERLKRMPSHMAYWFGWYAFHPSTEVYTVE